MAVCRPGLNGVGGGCSRAARGAWRGGPFGRAREGLQVGPFAQGGLDEPLRLAVGSGRVGPGALVLQAGGAAGGAEGVAAIGRAVVGHHPLDGDAEAGEPSDGPVEESHGTFLALVGQDLAVGEPGGVVDRDVQEVPADAARPAAAVAGDRLWRRQAPAPAETYRPRRGRWPTPSIRPSFLMSMWISSPGRSRW